MALVPVRDPEHRTLWRDPFAYCAHSHAVILPDGSWLLVFNQAPRRPVVLHPPQDPFFCNFLMRSRDQGETWSAPEIVPDFGWQGMECAGLTALADGRVLLHQWRFRWHPLAAARTLAGRAALTMPAELARGLDLSGELEGTGGVEPERLMPWARDGGSAFVHLSDDGGATFPTTVEIDTAPFAGGYNMRGAIALPDGRLLLPLCDIPAYERVFVVHSADRGASWGPPVLAAALPDRLFEEPCALALPDARILMLLRENRSRHLWQVISTDGGASWSEPAPTPIAGYPAHLLLFPDGRILCTYGHRQPDFSIRAVVASGDEPDWGLEPTLVIRGGLPNKDLGYPATLPHPDGRLTTVYYAQDPDGVTCIEATTFFLST
jgi:hypothetical protein